MQPWRHSNPAITPSIVLSIMSYYAKSASDLWQTPPVLYAELNDEFAFDFDPCPAHWDGITDGLTIPWGRHSFVNPPYSNVAKWIRKAHAEWDGGKSGKLVVMLINAITDTAAFHECIYGQADLRFIRGRVHFIRQGKVKAGKRKAGKAKADKVATWTSGPKNVRPSIVVIFMPKCAATVEGSQHVCSS